MTTPTSALRAEALLRERAGAELVERILHLDRSRVSRPVDPPLRRPERGARTEADVVFLGGGLSLVIAAELARLGVRVVVLERARAGSVHREWNASAAELKPLVLSGLFDDAELSAITVARYASGICAFHGGAPRVVRGVLDHAVDAAAFLARVREVAEARGVRFVDGATASGLGLGDDRVRVAWRDGSATEEIVASIAVDARGAASPYASADLVCPTVGGVVRGLDYDEAVGDILVTTEHAENGRQHIWEGFPGRPGELTTYLFYYAQAADVAGRPALLPLYARFFDTIGRYKSGTPELVRPTFGIIPGWSRLTPAPSGPHPRVVLVGDAAARHSPLTFCGFGAMLRSFREIARVLARAVDTHAPPPSPLLADDAIHGWTGLLARVMASESLQGASLNALLDDAFTSLADMGNDSFAALLQDRMDAFEFLSFLLRTAGRHPGAQREVARALGVPLAARWGVRLARSALTAGMRSRRGREDGARA